MNKLSLKVKTDQIILTDPSGQDQKWEIREMVASERDIYMDLSNARVELNEKGEVRTVKKFAGMQKDLLVRTLFLNGVPVTEAQVDSWPASVSTELYNKARVLNGLGKPAEESRVDAKNV